MKIRLTLALLMLIAVQATFGAPAGKGWLGLGFTLHTQPAVRGSKPMRYLYVRHPVPGGPAAAAGIQVGDVIAAINGKAIEFPTDHAALDFFAGLHRGDVVVFTIVRRSQRLQIRAVAAAPPSYAGAQWKRNYEDADQAKQ